MIDKSSSYKYTVAAEQNVKEKEYWSQQLAGELLKSTFPHDFPKGSLEPRHMELEQMALSHHAVDLLLKLAKGNDVKLHMILTAGLFVLLHQYSGHNDITMGSPILKQDAQLDFINTILVFRNTIHERTRFKQLLMEVRDTVIAANKNQNYPIALLIKPLELPVVKNEFPLFDVTICLENLYDNTFLQSIPYNMGFSFLRIGESIQGEVTYNTSLYHRTSIHRFCHHFSHLLEVLLDNMEVELSSLDLLTPEDKQRLLFDFNHTQAAYPKEKNLQQLFTDIVSNVPDNIALQGETCQWFQPCNGMTMSYHHLHLSALHLAGQLRVKGCLQGTIVAIMCEPGIEMMVGLWGILYAGATYLPIEPNYPESRINFILNDSGARFLLTTTMIQRDITLPFAHDIIRIDSFLGAQNWQPLSLPQDFPPVDPVSPAYIIYTSGTTGTPKGTITEHRQVVAYMYSFWAEFVLCATDVAIQLTTFTFDLFTEEIFPLLLKGGRIIIPTKADVLDFDLLYQLILTQQVTIIDCTPLLLNELNNRVAASPPNTLASVHTFISGGDVLKAEYVSNLVAIGKVYNTYGPTETTVCATYYRYTGEKNTASPAAHIPIGKPIGNYQVYILDKQNNPVPMGVGGELCIGGVGVARGYLNRPQLTHDTFINWSNASYPAIMPIKLYKTGDLTRWLPDGNIEFLGRLDFQVKIRGFRIELGEIEAQLLKHPLISEAFALAREEENGEKYICTYIVPRLLDATVTASDLREFLASRVPEYMIPAHFIWLDKMPLTLNGKIDRNALPHPEFKAYGGYVAPRNTVETKMVGIWAEILARDPDHASQLFGTIGIDDNFFELGGHSLRATTMMSKIHKELQVKIDLAEIFKTPTIREITRFIHSSAENTFQTIEPTEKKEYYLLSSAQKRLYFLQQLAPHSTNYNMPVVIPIAQNPEIDKLEKTFGQLIQRHESLRTSYLTVEELPVQKIHDHVHFKLEYHMDMVEHFIRYFDLAQAPLLRVAWFKRDNQHFLLLDMHHIISDGLSHQILQQDFLSLYQEHHLPPLRIQYKDFAEWQNQAKESPSSQLQQHYWLSQLAGEIPVLNLPTDFQRPIIQSFEGNALLFEISAMETLGLQEMVRQNGATMFIVLLAGFNILLAKLSGQEDIVVGTPIASRRHADLEKIIGMFVNTLALRNSPTGQLTFTEFLGIVKVRALDAFENQEYPFEDIVEHCSVNRDTSRNPLFDVMFSAQKVEEPQKDATVPVGEEADQNLLDEIYKNKTAKFDISLEATEFNDHLGFILDYCTKLFKRETVERFVLYFKGILTRLIQNPNQKLQDIEWIPEAEKHQLLVQFNQTGVDYPWDKTLHRLFEEQVARTPDRVAIFGPTAGTSAGANRNHTPSHLSYAQLNEAANQVASGLRDRGILPDSIVAILVERSIKTLGDILGILKAGAAYLPIDPDYPRERIDFMLKDSQALDLLNSFELYEPTPAAGTAPATPLPVGHAAALAYIIYTSGSTGKPKGVMVEHSAVVNLVCYQKPFFKMDLHDRVLQFSTLCFDASIEQVFTTLTSGAVLVLLERETLLDHDTFETYLTRQAITHLHAVPSFLNLLNPHHVTHVKRVVAGGDVCPKGLARVWSQGHDFYNEYGPTETTVTSVELWVRDGDEAMGLLPIGKPLGNTEVYILDKGLKPVPMGVTGEMVIGGAGVARGYLNSPSLTHEKFIRVPTLPNRLYKTGDLARWLEDGNIEFLGRLDHQVKIRGFRIELGEIENQLVAHPDIQEAVVAIKGDEQGDSYLCAYFVSARELDVSPLREYLALYLPDHMIPSYFIPLDRIPLTAIGKIDRPALPHPDLKGSKSAVAPRNETEMKLIAMWSVLLGMAKEEIGIHDNFFALGGHSLKATTMVSRIRKEFEVKVELTQIFRTPTIGDIARSILGLKKESFQTIEPVEEKEYYPLSSAQKRLFFLQQLDVASISYHMTMVLPLAKSIRWQTLDDILKKLITYHESLRTSFITVGDEPFQKIHPFVPFDITHFDLTQEPAQATAKMGEFIRDFTRPFDLSQAPLIRSDLITMPDNHCIWLVDMHHIISDGTSQTILTEDFFSLYQGQELPVLPLQYKDFSEWQNHLFASDWITAQQRYWHELYTDDIPRLNLPLDFERPPVFTFAGDMYRFKLEPEEAMGFRALGNLHGATLYMNIMAALNVLLYKYTGQTDIIIGSGIAGRPHTDLQHIVGMFVNTLVLRNHPEGEKTYLSFLQEVNRVSINAFENQDVQFEELVEKLDLERDPSRNPLFDISMVVQNFRQVKEESQPDILGENISGDSFKNTTAKFDLTFFIYEAKDEVYISMEYYTAIFTEATIARLAASFRNVIQTVIQNPTIALHAIDIISVPEREQLLYLFNETHQEFPRDKAIHLLFAEQVQRTPDAVALVHGDQTVTYAELDQQANRLAAYLYMEKGVGDGQPVGVWMSQSLNRQMALLGILKAGGSFVPLDPAIPGERIKYIINDARIQTVISQKYHVRDLNRLLWECHSFHSYVCLDSVDIQQEAEQEQNALMDLELWQHVGESATDEITGGGWLSSYTGKPFSKAEMDEYGDNILQKLLPLLSPDMNVLEIGCASGISMYRIAPKVHSYYGTDLSAAIIERNKKQVQEQGISNITLACLPAHDIHRVPEKEFQLIIINSVIQCFHGHNYLLDVIQKAIQLLGNTGYLFVGDVMNLETKEQLVRDLTQFKETHRDMGYTTKTDFSAELFLSPGYWQDLSAQYRQMESVVCSDKIYTIHNELTLFRYDVLIKINKLHQADTCPTPQRIKFQEDQRALVSRDPLWQAPPVPAHAPAYIIYTSGSTGKPKGVLVEHASLVNLCYWHNTTYGITTVDRATKYAGFSFDASVWEIFPYLLGGASLYLVPEEIILDVEALHRYYEYNRITIAFLPTQMCEQFMMLETSSKTTSLRVLLTGGDKLRNYIKRDYLLYNNYGPTENTVVTTSYPVTQVTDNIPIGKPIFNNQIYIVDSRLSLQPIGISGELCIAGESLARGYLNNPPLTHDSFISLTLSTTSSTWSTKIYKTGDLARWLSDGHIQFLGRLDQQVKIRGFRIELGEIEKQLLNFEQVKEAVVLARTDESNDAYLCAYIVPQNQWVASELRTYLAKCVPEYMIPAYFVPLETIPLTPQGKIDRKALPHPKAKTSDRVVAARDQMERQLVEMWSQILNIDSHMISITSSFFHLGGHSLKATTLVSKIHKVFHVKVPLVEIFRIPTIMELAQYIRGEKKELHVAIEPAEEKEYYRLSSSQRRLYFLHQLAPQSVGYNLPEVLNLGPTMEGEKLEKTFMQLIHRHESLRTSFHMIDEQPVQRVSPAVAFKMEYIAHVLDQQEIKDSTDQFVRPFDLAHAPLLRVALLKSQDNYLLLVDMHHIISDGLSHQILVRDFSELYQDHLLSPLRIQYKDFAEWLYRERTAPGAKSQESFWLNQFSGEIPVLNLPLDYPRPALQVFDGSTLHFECSLQDSLSLREIAQQANATIFMVLLTIFNILLSKLSNQEDIAVGTPIAGRRHADLEKLIGMFVNTLVLRNFPAGELSFDAFLATVNARALDAFENQEYPFEELVEKSKVNRDMGRNPLFDVLFSLLNMGDANAQHPTRPDQAENQEDYHYKHRTSKFDLSLYAMEMGPQLFFYFEYGIKLFKPQTIQRLVLYFKEIIASIIQNPATPLQDIHWIPASQKEQILYQFNHTATPYPQNKTLHHLFEEQVQRTPQHAAIIGATVGASPRGCPDLAQSPLTYTQFNEKANQLAITLQAQGVLPGTIVAIMLERSLDMMISLFAILKAGAAYLPIDPNYPPERIHYMLADSGATVVITEQWMAEVQTFCQTRATTGGCPYGCPSGGDGRNLAYVIYTSGSTGKPKGVLIEHHSLINRLFWMQQQYPLDGSDVILQKTTVTFDVSVWELFWWSLVGATLCLLPPGGEKDPAQMVQTIQECHVTVMHFVPSMLNVFLEHLDAAGDTAPVSSLKQVFASGEELTPLQVTQFNHLLHRTHATKLTNLYGPTEATIDVSYFDCSPQNPVPFQVIPIGKPIHNTTLYILDKGFHLQPQGVAGELCIGGVGLARGYLNRPDLTGEKFIPVSLLSDSPTTLYKTGDLARWVPDGNIEFLGRLDFQVKIRGFRIELGEIETRLLQHPDIKEAIVLTIEDTSRPGGEKALCAYIVSPVELDTSTLRAYLSQHLPAHMVPSFYKQVERMPLTPSGKTDRRALLAIGTRLGGGAQYLAPASDTELKIARIWADVLPSSDIKIGVHDNFFDMGGTSMDVMRLNSKMTQEFQQEIPIITFYKYTTIRALAHFVDHGEDNAQALAAASPETQAQRAERVEKGRVDRNKMRDMRKKSDRR